MSDVTPAEQEAIEWCEYATAAAAAPTEIREGLARAFADGGVVRVTLDSAPTVLVKMVDD